MHVMVTFILCTGLCVLVELVAYFQQGVTTARQQLAAGQELTGVLGRLVSAQDEEGNRWAGWVPWPAWWYGPAHSVHGVQKMPCMQPCAFGG